MTFPKVSLPVIGGKKIWPTGFQVGVSGSAFFKVALSKPGSFVVWPAGSKK